MDISVYNVIVTDLGHRVDQIQCTIPTGRGTIDLMKGNVIRIESDIGTIGDLEIHTILTTRLVSHIK